MSALGAGWAPTLLVAAVLALVSASAARLEVPAPALREHRARHTLLAYDVVRGEVRPVPAIDDLLDAPLPCGVHLASADGEATSADARAALEPGELFVTTTPLRDARDGRLLSVSPDSYSTIEAVRRLPLDTLEVVAVALADLSYVTNADAVAALLAHLGVELVDTGGVLRATERGAERGVSTYLLAVHPRFGPVLAIRGTGDLADVQRDFDAALVPAAHGGRVHAGFRGGADDVLARTHARLVDLYRRHGRLTLTGHSLGAGMATLVHVDLADELPGLRTFAFAPPPVGDARFVDAERGRIANLSAYFLPGEELENLALAGTLLDADALVWLGRRDVLPPVPIARGASHYLVNYQHAVLARLGASDPWWRALPACVVTDLPCFDLLEARRRPCDAQAR